MVSMGRQETASRQNVDPRYSRTICSLRGGPVASY